MSHSLIIRPANSDIANVADIAQWQWLECDRKGQPETNSRQGTQPPASESALLLIPANWLHTQRLQLPAMRRAQLQQAVPFALEEHVAGDIEQLHVAYGASDTEGKLVAAAIAADVIDGLLQQLQLFGIKVTRAMPDAVVCSGSESEWHIVELERDYLVGANDDFMLLNEDELSFLLEQQSQADDALAQLIWHGRNRPNFDHWPESLHTAIQVQLGQDPFASLAAKSLNIPFNLLQGKYTPAADRATTRGWKLAAGLAAAVVLVGFAYAVTDWWLLKNQSERYQTQVQDAFRETFPEITNVVNPRVQAERALADMNPAQGDALLRLLGGAAPVLAAQQGLVLHTVNYDRSGLRMEIAADSVAALDEFTAALVQQGLSARLDSAARSNDSVRGQVLIEGGFNG